MRICILLLFLLGCDAACFAQSIGINSDGSSPHSSAMLDIKSNNKGIIIPRVSLLSETDVTTIVNPATSVLVFNTNSTLPDGIGFHYWNGNRWTRLLTNSNALTLVGSNAWGMNGNNTADTNFIGTTNNRPLVFKANNIMAGKIDPGPNNVFFGQYSGVATSTATNNTFFGHLSGQSTTTGSDNFFGGHNAGNGNTTGTANVFIGQDAGRHNLTGSLNVFIGEDAGLQNTHGSDNVFLGNGAGRQNTYRSGNIAIGTDALSQNILGHGNVVIGDKAVRNSSRMDNVVAIGDSVLFNIGSAGVFLGTVAIGSKALFSNTDGRFNTAIGLEAMYANTTGEWNLAVGLDALRNSTSGSYNTAVGVSALQDNTNGNNNTAVGINALKANAGNDGNTAVGYDAIANFDGYANTAVGERALNADAFLEIAGDSNTAIGVYTGPVVDNLSNTTCLGSRATVTTSHTMVFGNSRVNRWAFGITTTNAQHALEVGEVFGDGNGAYLTQGGTWTNASDIHKKENITLLHTADVLNKIRSLPITRWKYKGGNEYHIGPMAQDFNKIFEVGVDDRGISTIDPAGVSLAGIQALAMENEKLKNLVMELLKRVEALERR